MDGAVRAKAGFFSQLASAAGSSSASAAAPSASISAFSVPSSIAGRFAGTSTISLPPTSSSALADASISPPCVTGSSVALLATSAGPSSSTSPLLAAQAQLDQQRSSSSLSHDSGKPVRLGSLRRKDVPRLASSRVEGNTAATAPTSSSASSTVARRKQPEQINVAVAGPDSPPPAVPLKPYPPQISDAAPQTPFQLSFPAGVQALDRGGSDRGTSATSPLTDAKATTDRSNPNTDPDAAVMARNERAFEQPRNQTRDSAHSTMSSLGGGSVVVTTANAVQIQRAMASTRQAELLSTSPHRVKQPLVDKGTGVKTRRKSRDSASSSVARRSKGARTSTNGAPASAPTAVQPPRKHGNPGDDAASSSHGTRAATASVFPRHMAASLSPPKEISSAETNIDGRGSGKECGRGQAERSHLPTLASNLPPQSSNRLAPIDIQRAALLEERAGDAAWTPHSEHTNSPSSAFGLQSRLHSPWPEQGHFDGSSPTSATSGRLSAHDDRLGGRNGGRNAMGASDVYDPHSDQWGMSNASLSIDEDLMSPTAHSMVPQTQRSRQRQPRVSAFNIHETPHTTKANHKRDSSEQSNHGAMPHADVSLKDTLLRQLMASVALVDAQACSQLSSLDDVELCKRDIRRLEQRTGDLQNKLKVHMRVRDAANKLRRAATRNGGSSSSAAAGQRGGLEPSDSMLSLSSTGHRRQVSTASSATGATSTDVQKAEADAIASVRSVDAISRELFDVQSALAERRQQLLQHHASVLAARVESLEEEQASMSRTTHESTVATTDEEDEGVFRRNPRSAAATASAATAAKASHVELAQLRDELDQEKAARSKDEAGHRDDIAQLQQKHRSELDAQTLRHDTAVNESERQLQQSTQRHDRVLAEKALDFSRLQDELHRHRTLAEEKETARKTLQKRMEVLEVEIGAERDIMREGQQLFTAFEARLERAESRLREQDDRCARMLGKLDGREEMDDLLSQIKAGYRASAEKKKKTAGQDIDGLIDSISTHINDVEDELVRTRGLRSFESGLSSHGLLEGDDMSARGSTTQEHGKLRELAVELQSAQREANEWRMHAESSSRQLKVLQRQSAISAVSSPNPAFRPSTRLSTSTSAYGGFGGGAQSGNAGRRPSAHAMTTPGSLRSAAELEARVTLLEKRNAALESELSARPNDVGYSATSDNPTKNGITSSAVYAKVVRELLHLLPQIDTETTDDLHELQEALEQLPHESDAVRAAMGGHQMCATVAGRTRSVLFVSRSLVGKALALEMQRRELEEEIVGMENKCDDLQQALESVRVGQASQMQATEASQLREKQLQKTVDDLRKSLEGASRSTTQQLNDDGDKLAVDAPAMSRSTTGPGSLQTRRTGPFTQYAQAALSTKVPSPTAVRKVSGPKLGIPISPSASKLSFPCSPASTPGTSQPSAVAPWSTTANAPISAMEQAQKANAQPPSLTPSSSASRIATCGPRTMALGMDSKQLMLRIRELESEVQQARMSPLALPNKSSAAERAALEEQLQTMRAHVEENEREIMELRNIESRQRIALLEELTSLTSELSAARAELRRTETQQRAPPVA